MGEWHAMYGGSGADRWMQCYGSTGLMRYLPETLEFKGNEYTEEGTVAHALAEQCAKPLVQSKPALDPLDPSSFLGMYGSPDGTEFIRTSKPGWYEVTQEMVDAVFVYLMEIEYWRDLLGGDVYVEKQVRLTENIGGTADAVIIDPLGTVMVVIDFKYGQGHAVEVVQNRQAQFYGYVMKTDLQIPADEVVLVIVQPRAQHAGGPVRRWSTTGDAIEDFGQEIFRAVNRNEQPGAPLIPGEAQCRWCDAKPLCPAAREVALQAARETFAEFLEGPDLSEFNALEALSKNLDVLPEVESWVKAVKEAAHVALTKDRKAVPGYKLVYGKQGNRIWKDEQAVIKELSRSKNISKSDYLTEPKLLSPAQLEKTGKVEASWVAAHVKRADRTTKVVRVDAKGEDVPNPFADIIEDTDW